MDSFSSKKKFKTERSEEFLCLVENDIKLFIRENPIRCVLIFPPFNNHRRFLIHRLGGDLKVKTFSVGAGLLRFVVVYVPELFESEKHNEVSDIPDMITRIEKKGAISKGRKPKPELALYVPPAIRNKKQTTSSATQTAENSVCSNTKNINQEKTDPPREMGVLTVNDDKTKLIHRKQNENSTTHKNILKITNFPSDTTKTSLENMFLSRNINVKSIKLSKSGALVTFQDDFTASQVLDIFKYILFKGCSLNITHYEPEDKSDVAQVNVQSSINKCDLLCSTNTYKNNTNEPLRTDADPVKFDQLDCSFLNKYSIPVLEISNNDNEKVEQCRQETSSFVDIDCKNHSPGFSSVKLSQTKLAKKENKDSDNDTEELLRASEEINRRNKRIMKPTFNQSDLLIISNELYYNENEEFEGPDCWEDLFDKDGGIDTSILNEIVQQVGDVNVTKTKGNYTDFLEEISLEDDLSHVIEIYDFPTQFQTRDLITVIDTIKCGSFHIKWVDDTHALGIFASGFAAAKALCLQHPLMKLRPLSVASKQSISKAKKFPKTMTPVIERPQTCPQTAIRMVSGALGVKLSNAREERKKELQILKEAKEKKKLTLQQELDAWEGKPSK